MNRAETQLALQRFFDQAACATVADAALAAGYIQALGAYLSRLEENLEHVDVWSIEEYERVCEYIHNNFERLANPSVAFEALADANELLNRHKTFVNENGFLPEYLTQRPDPKFERLPGGAIEFRAELFLETSNQTEIMSLPRWLQIPQGLVLCVFLLPCFAGSVALAVSPNERAPIMAPVVGTLMALACLWLFAMSFRLILGKKKHGGLMGPRALRLCSWIFVLIPTTSISTGTFFEHPFRYGVISVAYILTFFGLRSLAFQREQKASSQTALVDDFQPLSG